MPDAAFVIPCWCGKWKAGKVNALVIRAKTIGFTSPPVRKDKRFSGYPFVATGWFGIALWLEPTNPCPSSVIGPDSRVVDKLIGNEVTFGL